MSKNPNTYNHEGMDYIYPTAYLLSDNGIGQSEYAARQCYNSFDKSENSEVIDLRDSLTRDLKDNIIKGNIKSLQNVEHSALLEQLSFVHFHESTLEHSVLSFLLTDFSRGVLQELARHRIASYSVMSTRYTMASLINAFTASMLCGDGMNKDFFIKEVMKYDMFVTADESYNRMELGGIYDKLRFHFIKLCNPNSDDKWDWAPWLDLTVAGSTKKEDSVRAQLHAMSSYDDGSFDAEDFGKVLELLNSKDKRNVGDPFKHIITDNFKVNAVMTINLRSFKNFLQLRDSGSAWFQIDKLAKEMKSVTPEKYLKLIIKNFNKEN